MTGERRRIQVRIHRPGAVPLSLARTLQYIDVIAQLLLEERPELLRLERLLPQRMRFELSMPESCYTLSLLTLRAACQGSNAGGEQQARLEVMLVEDLASAEFIDEQRKRIAALQPRKLRLSPVVGPLLQNVALRGQLSGLLGSAGTKQARIIVAGSNEVVCGDIEDLALAKRVARHLWGDILEFRGRAMLRRDAREQWRIEQLQITEYHRLEMSSPAEIMHQVGQLLATTALATDPAQLLRSLRH